MTDLLSRPEVQLLTPFAAVLVLVMIFRSTGAVNASLAACAGVIIGFLILNGLQFTPLTGARKIMLCAAVLPVVLALVDRMPIRIHNKAIIVALFALALVYWLLIKMIPRYELLQLVGIACGGGLFCVWVSLVVSRQAAEPVLGLSTCLALGIGVGACVILGASALLGTMGLMLAAATAAALLIAVIFKQRVPGFAFIATVAILVSLIALAGLAFASLHWLSLPMLALVPLVSWWLNNRIDTWPRIFRAAVLVMGGLIPVAAAAAANFFLIEQSSGY